MASEYKEYEDKMQKAIDFLDSQFAAVRAGRANASVLDQIMISYYGTPTPLQQVANISSPDPRQLVIQPYDAGILGDIEKAVLASDLGINPQNDGKMIRLSFPQLTEDRRRDLAKQVKKYGEDSKIIIRNVRRDALEFYKKQQKSSEITEDDYKNVDKDMQKRTDDAIKQVEERTAKKEKELSEL